MQNAFSLPSLKHNAPGSKTKRDQNDNLVESGDLFSQICASSRVSVLILIVQLQSLGLENIQFFMCFGQDDTLDSFCHIFKTLAVKQDASALIVYYFCICRKEFAAGGFDMVIRIFGKTLAVQLYKSLGLVV